MAQKEYSFGDELLRTLLIWPIFPLFLCLIGRRVFFLGVFFLYFGLFWGALGWIVALSFYFSRRKKYKDGTSDTTQPTRYSYVVSALMLGYFGVHNFYARRYKSGYCQLLLLLLGIIITCAIGFKDKSVFGDKYGFYDVSQDFLFNFILPFIQLLIFIILNGWIIFDILTVKTTPKGKTFLPSPWAPTICVFLSGLFMIFIPVLSSYHRLVNIIKEYPYTSYENAYYIRRLKDRAYESVYWDTKIYTCSNFLKPLPSTLSKCFFSMETGNGKYGLTIMTPDLDDEQLDELSKFFTVSKDKGEIHY